MYNMLRFNIRRKLLLANDISRRYQGSHSWFMQIQYFWNSHFLWHFLYIVHTVCFYVARVDSGSTLDSIINVNRNFAWISNSGHLPAPTTH